jgi:hypothetical protein
MVSWGLARARRMAAGQPQATSIFPNCFIKDWAGHQAPFGTRAELPDRRAGKSKKLQKP